jgi:hypothetical protein
MIRMQGARETVRVPQRRRLDPDTGRYRPLSVAQKQVNATHARQRGPGERVNVGSAAPEYTSSAVVWRARGVDRVPPGMSIGASIFLIAVGLILALAVNVDLSGIDVQTIGWILTLVGVGGLVLSLAVWNRRRVTVREEAVVRDQPVVRDTPVVREERVIREDPPSY